jgi:hypothetical protein
MDVSYMDEQLMSVKQLPVQIDGILVNHFHFQAARQQRVESGGYEITEA